MAKAVPLIALALLALAALVACEEGAEEAPTGTPATPTPPPTPPPGGAGGGGQVTVVPITTPFPSPPPIPPDWATYSNPTSDKSAAFSFRHPADWVVQGGDPTSPGVGLTIVMWSWTAGKAPPGAIKVDVIVHPPSLHSCESDNSGQAALGGVAAWRISGVPDPTLLPGVRAIETVAADYAGWRYCITGYLFEGADSTVFEQVVDSFRFTP